MALIKFGAGISEMRGKEGGVIYSRNAYGSYIKSKVSPVNPQSNTQQLQRQQMGNLSQAWAGLTAEQKAGWVNLGSQVTRVNRFGDTTYYTGFAMFMRLNRNLVLCGQTALTTAPSITNPTAAVLTEVAGSEAEPSINLTFSPTVPTGHAMVVYATNNILTGREFVKNYYRVIKVIAAAQTSPQDISTEWIELFGAPPLEGAKIFVKIKNVVLATGFDSVPSVGSGVMSA